MDEPLGALDKQLREQMQYEIKHLHEELEITVVYVTHDQSEALTMSDRVAVFNDGVIQQLASPNELYEKPTNSFVAQFIGENNKFDGKVISIDGEIVTVEVNGNEFKALAVNSGDIGEKTTISIRPEIRVTPLENVADMRLLNLYLGDHIRCRLSVEKIRNLLKPNSFNEG